MSALPRLVVVLGPTASGKEPLDTAAASAIRATSPFEPLPPQFKGPYIDLRIGFYYNIRPDGATQ